jgi:multidrug efflux pump subunit AcrA (membrane-fusion protein)
MESSRNTNKLAVVISLALFLGAVTWGGFQYRANSSLETQLDNEKLESESRLSEKLFVEKDLEKAKAQLALLDKRNKELDKSIQSLSQESEVRDDKLAKLQRELAANKKKTSEFQALQADLENQLTSLNASLQLLRNEKENLSVALAASESRNESLKDELGKAHLAYYDRPLVEPLRGKSDKLMAKASRTQRLRTTLMLPDGLKDVQFKISNPNGEVISNSPDHGTLAVRTIETGAGALASTNNTVARGYKQVEMIFIAKEKLAAGVYTIEVQSEGLPVGSLQLRLR